MLEVTTVTYQGLRGRLVRPEQPNGGGVLLMPGWAGLEAGSDRCSQELAGAGFTVLGWDPFSAHPEDVSAEVRRRVTQGELTDVAARAEHVTWLDYLEREQGVTGFGTIGFCMGGRMSIHLPAGDARIRGVAAYYPTLRDKVPAWGIDPTVVADDIHAPIMIQYPQADRVTPPESMVRLRTALEARPSLDTTIVQFHPQATHGFLSFDGTRDVPDEVASRVAWPTTLAFFRATLLDQD